MRLEVAAGGEGLALHALQFASLMLTRNRDGRWRAPQAVAFQVYPSEHEPGFSLPADEADDDEPAAAAGADSTEAAAGAAGEGQAEGQAAEGQVAAKAPRARAPGGQLLSLHRVPAEDARRAANAAPLFSVRADSDAAARGAELAAELLGGIEGGKLAVLLKCWGLRAMPVAAQVRRWCSCCCRAGILIKPGRMQQAWGSRLRQQGFEHGIKCTNQMLTAQSPPSNQLPQALLVARRIMRAQGHDLIAVCDLRSEAAPPPKGRASDSSPSDAADNGGGGGGGAGATQWRWRFLVASCPAGTPSMPSADRTTPYLFSGGPPGAAAAAGAVAAAAAEATAAEAMVDEVAAE